MPHLKTMFEIHKSLMHPGRPSSPFYWEWVTKTGRLLARSRPYKTKIGAENAIFSALDEIEEHIDSGKSPMKLIIDKTKGLKTGK